MCTSIKVIFLGVDIFALRSERQSRALRERILLTLRRYNTNHGRGGKQAEGKWCSYSLSE